MSSIKLNLVLCSVILCILVCVNTQSVHRRFEYKYSFKPPYLAQKDGSVPFWEYGGNAIASGESVRLAPSLRSQKGAIWSKQPLNFDWWEIDIMFKVTGRGRIGADGLAFWYTTQRGDYTGEVFGSSDRWNGLAVIFDSDGSQQLLSGCLRDFRNKPFPTRARIEYYLNTLTVYFHNGMTNNEADYELCFRAENVVLPRGGYLGLSAATGGLADDHDVRDKDGEFDDWFESDAQRELRQIFQGQNQIHDVLRGLNKKIDEVIGKQMNSLSMLTAVYSHTQGQPLAPGAAPPAQMPALPIGRHDWDALVANNQVMINTIAELKGFIIEVSRKSDAMVAGGGGGGSAINPQFLNEMRDSINTVKATVAGVAQRIQSGAPQVAAVSGCPEVSCVSFYAIYKYVYITL
ncbi:hypothetical protein SFRURICE_016048 [Spodoptera frugiperda]|nr:hypothetical protein SFRURICE_016048 [Spodoptera frugiperda]